MSGESNSLTRPLSITRILGGKQSEIESGLASRMSGESLALCPSQGSWGETEQDRVRVSALCPLQGSWGETEQDGVGVSALCPLQGSWGETEQDGVGVSEQDVGRVKFTHSPSVHHKDPGGGGGGGEQSKIESGLASRVSGESNSLTRPLSITRILGRNRARWRKSYQTYCRKVVFL